MVPVDTRKPRMVFHSSSCDYANSKTALQEIQVSLINSGFQLNEHNSSFLAENESFTVFCVREGGNRRKGHS